MDERKEEVEFLTQDEVTRLALQRFEQRFGSQKYGLEQIDFYGNRWKV